MNTREKYDQAFRAHRANADAYMDAMDTKDTAPTEANTLRVHEAYDRLVESKQVLEELGDKLFHEHEAAQQTIVSADEYHEMMHAQTKLLYDVDAWLDGGSG